MEYLYLNSHNVKDGHRSKFGENAPLCNVAALVLLWVRQMLIHYVLTFIPNSDCLL